MSNSDQPLPPEEEEVRRLLAEARHTGPTPPKVVARLDRVLDNLAHEPDRAPPVVDLARRRRRVASLLVAAAAVVVVGIGVAQVINTQGGGDATSAESGAQARQPAAGDAQSEAQDSGQPKAPLNGANEPAPAPDAPTTSGAQEKSDLIELRRHELADGFIVARRRLAAVDSQASSVPSSADRAAGAACGVDQWGRGRFVPVSYAGVPAVVVFRRPVGDSQVADLFLCGGEEPVRSVTLPAP